MAARLRAWTPPKACAAELDLVAGDPRPALSSVLGELSSHSPSKHSPRRIMESVAMSCSRLSPLIRKSGAVSVEVEARQLLHVEVEPLDGSAIVVFVVADALR